MGTGPWPHCRGKHVATVATTPFGSSCMLSGGYWQQAGPTSFGLGGLLVNITRRMMRFDMLCYVIYVIYVMMIADC